MQRGTVKSKIRTRWLIYKRESLPVLSTEKGESSSSLIQSNDFCGVIIRIYRATIDGHLEMKSQPTITHLATYLTISRTSLRTSNKRHLSVHWARHAFSCLGPSSWNCLQLHMRDVAFNSAELRFSNSLKPHLFLSVQKWRAQRFWAVLKTVIVIDLITYIHPLKTSQNPVDQDDYKATDIR